MNVTTFVTEKRLVRAGIGARRIIRVESRSQVAYSSYPDQDSLLAQIGVGGRRLSKIDASEGAARHEYLNLAAGEPAHGLGPEEIRSICRSARVEQCIF